MNKVIFWLIHPAVWHKYALPLGMSGLNPFLNLF